METPEKIYVTEGMIFITNPEIMIPGDNKIEYVHTDAFIENAAEFLYNYNQKQVLKHGARATLGCGEYTINVDEFRKYMKESIKYGALHTGSIK